MARSLVYNYTFSPSTKQVTIPGNIIKDRLLIITNTTAGIVIYNFADPSLVSTAVQYSSSTENTTVTLKYDTTLMSATDSLSIFIDNPSVNIEPSTTYADPVSKFRVSTPETLIDTDFEYGLQPTKWETLELVNNTPSFFSRSNDTTIPNIQDISTLAGSRIVTITCTSAHGLAPGIPIDIRGTREVTCDGTYIIDSTPTTTTFKYLAKVKQSLSKSIYDIYSNINIGQFFTGSNIQLANVSGITTDGNSSPSTNSGVSTLTLKTDFPHGFGINTPFYLLNLNTSITKNFDGSNSGTIKNFTGEESNQVLTITDGTNSYRKYVDASNTELNGRILNSTLFGAITRTFNSENNQGGGLLNYTATRSANKTYAATDGAVNSISGATAGSGFSDNGYAVSVNGGSGSGLKTNYIIQGPVSTVGSFSSGGGYTGNGTAVSLTGGSGSGATGTFTTTGTANAISLTGGGTGYTLNSTAVATTATSGSGTGLLVNYTANGTTGDRSIPVTPGTNATNLPTSSTSLIISSIVPSTSTFTINFSSGGNILPAPVGTYISLSGVTPSIYNGTWLIGASTSTTVTITPGFSTSNWITASVNGTATFYGDRVNVATTSNSGGTPSGLTMDYFYSAPLSGLTITNSGIGYNAGSGVATTCVQGGLTTLGTITAGTGYVNGIYYNVPLTTQSGTGAGATANITVAGGAVSAPVVIVNPGAGYTTASVLSVNNLSVGGSGSGFSIPVTAVGGSGATVTTTVGGSGVATTTYGGVAGTFSNGSGATYNGVYTDVALSAATAAGTLVGGGYCGFNSTSLYVGGQTLSTILPGMWITGGTNMPTNTYVVSTTPAVLPSLSSVNSNLTAFTGTGFIGNGAASPAAGTTLSITGVTSGTLAANSYLWGSTVTNLTSETRITTVNSDTFNAAIGDGSLDDVTTGTVLTITGTIPGTFTDGLAPGRILSGSGVTANTMITAVNNASISLGVITPSVYVGSTLRTILSAASVTGFLSKGMSLSGGAVTTGTAVTSVVNTVTITSSIPASSTTMTVTATTGQIVLGIGLTGASISPGSRVTAQLTATNASATTGLTATGTTGTNTITVSANTGIVVGQFVQPITGVPTNTYVTNINGNIITISNNLTGAGLSNAAINFYTAGSTGTYTISITNSLAGNATVGTYYFVNNSQTLTATNLTGKSYTVDTSQAVVNNTSITGLNYTVNTSQLASSKGTATTIKSSGTTQPVGFIVTHGGGTLTPNTFINLSGVSVGYNQTWLIASSTATNFYVQNYADNGNVAATGVLTVGAYVTLSAVTIGQLGNSGGASQAITVTSGTAGSGATANITVTSGAVSAVTIRNDGTTYNATDGTASVLTTTAIPGLTGFTLRVASLKLTSINSVTVSAGGTGYRIGDILQVQSLTARVLINAVSANGGVVKTMRQNTAGTGYDHACTVTITAGASANPTFTVGQLALGTVRVLTINNPTSATNINYSAGNTFTFAISGTPLSGGTTLGTASISNITGGKITSFTLTGSGTNYKLGDTLTIPGATSVSGTIASNASNFTIIHAGNFYVASGSFITISGASVATYNRTWQVASSTLTTIVVTSTLNPGAATGATVATTGSVPVTALIAGSSSVVTGTISAASVGVPGGNGISSWTFAGTGVGTNSYTNVAATGGIGNGATFNLRCSGGAYTIVPNTFGTGYVPTDVLTISGTLLGGVSPANDATITINNVNSTGFGYNASGGADNVTITGSSTNSTFTIASVKQSVFNFVSITGTDLRLSDVHNYSVGSVFILELTSSATSITNLTVGNSYWVRATGTNTVAFFASYANAVANTTPIAIALGAKTSTFTIKQLNQTTDEAIRLPGHGFSVGDMVAYFNNGGTSVGGLTSTTFYWVKTLFGTDYFNLSSTPGPAAVQSGATVVNVTTAGVGQTQFFYSSTIDYTLNFIYNSGGHGLTDNTPYYFTQAASATVNGLTTARTYYIRTVDTYRYSFATAFNTGTLPLAVPSVGAVDIADSTGGTSYSGNFAISQAAIDTFNNEFWIPAHNLIDSQSISYSNNGGNSLTNLTTGGVYYARVLDANRFYLATTHTSTTRITLVAPNGTGNNANQSQSFTNTTANLSNNTLWIPKTYYAAASTTFTTTSITANGVAWTLNLGTPVATTAVTSTQTTFVVTAAGTWTAGQLVAISGVTPGAYNDQWRIAVGGSGSFTVHSNINSGTATVQGTVKNAVPINKGEYIQVSGAVPGVYNGIWPVETTSTSVAGAGLRDILTIKSPLNIGSATTATVTIGDIAKPVLYSSGSGTAVGGLISGRIYYIQSLSSDLNEVRLSNTPGGAAITLTTTSTETTHNIKRVNFVSTSVGSTATGDSTDYFYIPSHGFTSGDKINYDSGIAVLRVTSVSSGIVTGVTIVKRGTNYPSSSLVYSGLTNSGGSGSGLQVTLSGVTRDGAIQSVSTIDVGGAGFSVGDLVSLGAVNNSTAYPGGVSNLSTGTQTTVYYAKSLDANRLQISNTVAATTAITLGSQGNGINHTISRANLSTTGGISIADNIITTPLAHQLIVNDPVQYTSGNSVSGFTILSGGTGYTGQTCIAAVGGSGSGLIVNTATTSNAISTISPPISTAITSTSTNFTVTLAGLTTTSITGAFSFATAAGITTCSLNVTVGTGIKVGMTLIGTNIPDGTKIVQLGTGTGGTGTYIINNNVSLISSTFTGYDLNPGTEVSIANAVPALYNGRWIVSAVSNGSFTVNSNINPGTASTQGTISTGSGYLLNDVVYITGGSPEQSATATISSISSGFPISGLTDGNIYYIKSVPTTKSFTLSSSQGGDVVDITDSGIPGNANGLGPHSFKKVFVDSINNIFYIPAHGFVTNQPVTYSKSTSNYTIRGLMDGQIYYINRIDENKFTLLNSKVASGGTTVDITGSGSRAVNSAHRFTSTPVLIGLNEIWIPNHGFATSDAITYNTGGGTAIGSFGSAIFNLGVYFAIKIDGDYIALASSSAFSDAGTAIDVTSAGVGTSHNFISSAAKPDGIYRVTSLPTSLVYRDPTEMKCLAAGVIAKTVKTIDPRQVVDPDQDLIRLSSHGFTIGTQLLYSSNSNTAIDGLTDNTTYYVISINRDYVKLATTSANAFSGSNVDITGFGSGSQHFFTTSQINGEVSANGTVSTNAGVAVVTGLGTLFSRYLKVGDNIKIYPSDTFFSVTGSSITTGISGISPGTLNLTGVPSGWSVGYIRTFTYNVTGGTAITGLTSGYTYFIRVITITNTVLPSPGPNAQFSLYNTFADANSQTNGIILTAALPSGTHTFTYTTPSTPILRQITAIASDTSLSVDTSYGSTYTSVAYTFPTFAYVRPEGYNLHRPYDGGVEMNTGSSTSDGDQRYVTGNCQIIRQTRKYFRYQSGKGIQVSFGINFKPSTDIVSLNSVSGLATAITRKPHGLTQGLQLVIGEGEISDGTSNTPFNGTFSINLGGNEKEFTYSLSSNPSDRTITRIGGISNDGTTLSTGTVSHPYYVGQPITFATTTNGVTVNTTYYVVSIGNDGGVAVIRNNTFTISSSGGIVSAITNLTAGSGYTAGTGVATTGGTGTGLTVNTTVDSGTIIGVVINNGGNGYKVGDGIFVGGTFTVPSTFTVASVSQGSAITSLTNGTGLTISCTSRIGNCYGYPKFYVNGWSNARNRAGLFDTQNGMFFEYDGQELRCVRRSSTQQLSGTLSVLQNSNLVIGDATLFTKQLDVADKIVIRGQIYKVTYIASDLQMTIAPSYRGSNGTTLSFDSTLYKGATSLATPSVVIPTNTMINVSGITTANTMNGTWIVASSSANSVTINASGVSGAAGVAAGIISTPYGTFPIATATSTASSLTITFATGGEGYTKADAGNSFVTTAITSTATTFTVTATSIVAGVSQNYVAGNYVTISGVTPIAYNGTWQIASFTTNNQFVVNSTINSGTAITQGRVSHIGVPIARVPYGTSTTFPDTSSALPNNNGPFTALTYGAGYGLTYNSNIGDSAYGFLLNTAVTGGTGTGLVGSGSGGGGMGLITVRGQVQTTIGGLAPKGSGYTTGTYTNIPVLQAPTVVVNGSVSLTASIGPFTLSSVAGIYPGMYASVTGGTGTIPATAVVDVVNISTSQVTFNGAVTAGTATQITFWSGRIGTVQATVDVTVAGGGVTFIRVNSVSNCGVGYSATSTGTYNSGVQTTGASAFYIAASSIGGTSTNPVGFNVASLVPGRVQALSIWDMGTAVTNGGYSRNDTLTFGTPGSAFSAATAQISGTTLYIPVAPTVGPIVPGMTITGGTTAANTTITSYDGPSTFNITTASGTGTITITATSTFNYVAGMQVLISGHSNANINGTWVIVTTTANTSFTITVAGQTAGTGGTVRILSTGGIGYYTVSTSQTVASATITGNQPATFKVNSLGCDGNSTSPTNPPAGTKYVDPNKLTFSYTTAATGGGATTSSATPVPIAFGQSYDIADVFWLGGSHTVGKQGIVQVLSNKTNVDTINDTFTITSHGLTGGQPIVYNAGDGNAVGGLLTGNTYYVIYKSIDQFQLAPSYGSVTAIDLTSFGATQNNRFFPAKTTVIASTVVDTAVPQSQWNLDKATGNGPSGYILDLTKMQMAYLDYSWYGAGKARFGFKDQDAIVRYVHEFRHNNKFLKAYMRSGNMPCRYEVENLTNPTYSPSISHWGTSVIMDGRFDDDNAYLFTAASQNLTLGQTFPKNFYGSDLNTSGTGAITIYNHSFGAAGAIFQASISSTNNKSLPSTISIYGASGSGYSVTITSTTTYFTVVGNFGVVTVGSNVTITGSGTAAYNATWTVSTSTTNQFTVVSANNSGSATGTLSVGGVWVRVIDTNSIKLYDTNTNATGNTATGLYTYTLTTLGGTGGIFQVSPYLSSAQSYYQPLVSVRLSPSVDSGLTGALGDRDIINRMQLRFKEISVTTNYAANIRLLLNANLSNLSFASASAPSLAQLLQHGSGDTVNNGVIVYEFRAPGGSSGSQQNTTIDIKDLYELGNSILGGSAPFPDGPDILTIAASRLELPATGNVIINSKFSWTEAQA